MKKVKSLTDLQRLMESLGAVKDEEPGFTSWTLDCGPGHKPTSPQAGGPAHKESGFKRPSLTGCKL